MWKFIGALATLFVCGVYAGFVLPIPAGTAVAVKGEATEFSYPYLSAISYTQLPQVQPAPTVAASPIYGHSTATIDARFAGVLSHVRWLMARRGTDDTELVRLDKQVLSLMDDVSDDMGDLRDEINDIALPDAFTVDDTGTITAGIWQGTPILDGYIADVLTIGAGSSFANNIVTPNSLMSAGQLDEYCLTYEGTGTTFEWQSCASGSITTADLDTSAEFASIVSDETGTGALVFGTSPTFGGTVNAAAATLSSTLTMTGSAANIALGSNYLSGDGDDEGVYVSSAGMVGIGTTTPVSRLTISETNASTNLIANSSYQIRIENNDTTNNTIGGVYVTGKEIGGIQRTFGNIGFIKTDHTAGSTDSEFFITTRESGTLSEKFRLTNSGNVGIGTTSPYAKLSVAGNSAFTGQLNLSGSAANIALGSNYLSGDGGDEGIYVDTAGKVGIGTTTPSDLLTLQSVTNTVVRLVNTGANDPILYFDANRTTANAGLGDIRSLWDGEQVAKISFLSGDDVINKDEGYISFSTRNSGDATPRQRLTIDKAGNVGIGTSTPQRPLSVVGTISSTDNVYFGEYTTSPNLVARISNSTGTTLKLHAGVSGVYMGSETDTPLFLRTNNTDRMYISNTGNVGIGDTSPTALLTVGSGDLFQVNSSGAIAAVAGITTTGQLNLSGTAANIALGSNYLSGDGDDEGVFVDASGNVGIGDTSPSAKLEVVGTSFPVVSVVRDSSVTNDWRSAVALTHRSSEDMVDGFGTELSFRIADSAGVFNGIGNLGAVRDGSDNEGALTFRAGTNGLKEFMRITSVGNIGIGTTSPSAKLHLNNSAGTASDLTFLVKQENTASNALIQLDRAVTERRAQTLFSTAGTVNWALGIPYNSGLPSSDFHIGTGVLASDAKLSVLTSGNVGIGDTSPTALLTVGSGDLFQVNSSGAIAAVTGITTTGQLNLSGTAANIALGSNYLSGDGGDEGIFVDASGNVGIGTSVPDTLFHLTTLNSHSVLRLERNDTGINADDIYGSFEFEGQDTGGAGVRASINAIGEGVNGQAALVFNTMSGGAGSVSERLRITSAGNLGIGTTTPSQKLHVYSSGQTQALFQSTDVASYLMLADAGSISASGQGIGSSGNNLVFRSNGGTRATLSNAGYFGIGTTTPGALLDVQGAAQFGTSNVNLITSAGKITGLSSTYFGTDTSANLATILTDETGTGNVVFSASPTFTGTALLDAFTVTATSTIGGNSYGPSGMVFGSGDAIYSPDNFRIYDTSNGQFRFGYSTSNTYNTRTGGAHFFQVNGSQVAVLDSTGRLGLNDTSPDYRQEIVTTLGSGYFGITNSADGDVFVVTSAGNVGVATSSPYAKFSVAGNSAFTGQLNLSGSAANIALGSNYLSGDGGDEGVYIDSTGNVGVGLSNPSDRFEVKAAGNDDGIRLQGSGAANLAWLHQQNTDAAILRLYDGGTETIRLNSEASGVSYFNTGGNFGIGTTTPLQKLQVFGDVRVGTAASNGCIEDYGGGVIMGTCSSDERLKENIESLASSTPRSYLEALASLIPVTYNWNKEAATRYAKNTNVANIGLIAQDVEAAFPELVSQNSDGYRQVDFRALPFYLIEAVKELWAKVQGHDERLENLERENEYLKSRLNDIESELTITPDPTPELVEQAPDSEPQPAPEPEVVPEPTPEPTPLEISEPVL